MTLSHLVPEIRGILRRGVQENLPDGVFNELAVKVFRFQCRENSAYGGFVARRGVNPHDVERWEEVPYLPTRAFRSAALVAGPPETAQALFRTSGTTGGPESRGEHHVLDLQIYRDSLLPNFKAHLLPDLSERVRILSLLPSPEAAPDSSLAFMVGVAVDSFGVEGSGFFVDHRGDLDAEGFSRALDMATMVGAPILVAGTAFAFAQWGDMAREGGKRVQLPPESRIMETGGYKGRRKALPRSQLYQALEESLGIPEGYVVNEYGMTELLSQFYEAVLPGSPGPGRERKISPPLLSERCHRGPPWVRTRVLDPASLEAVPHGEVGVLAHFDLANVASVSPVLTEDLGRLTAEGFQLLGRNPGSEPRGCSLAMEHFLEAWEDRA